MQQLFKNRKKQKEHDYLDDIYSSLYDDKPKEEKSLLKEREEKISSKDPDLDVLDDLINGNYYNKKSYKKEQKKKDKKDKKKKKKSDKKNKKKNKKLLDLSDIYDGLDNVGEDRERVKRDDDGIYQQRANGTLILLRETMKQVNEQITTSKTYLEELKQSRMRGALTAITAQTANMSSLLGTKLNVIKHITDVNNKLSDIEIKRAKEIAAATGGANGEGAAINEDYLMNNILKKVMNSDEFDIEKEEIVGKKKKKSKKDKKDKEKDDIYEHLIQGDNDEEALELARKKDGEKDIISSFYDEDDEDEFDDDFDEDADDLLDKRISEMESEGDLEFSSTERAFKYEGRVKLAIEKDHQNDRWRFIALDDEDEEIVDYPLPTKKAVGRISFDKEKGIAEDKLGNVYEIFYKNKYSSLD